MRRSSPSVRRGPRSALALIALLGLPAILAAPRLAADGPAMPALVAHRGASHDAPENTLAAFRLAWEQGADAIEGDFHLTADGEIVCIHDGTTKKVAGRDLVVARSTLAELRELDVGSWKGERWKGERIPTLAEVLGTVPEGKRVLIEIKCGPEILPALEEALAASPRKPEETVIIAFDEEVIAGAKRAMPGRKALWLTSFEKEKETGRWTPSTDEVLSTLGRIGADGVDCKATVPVDRAFAGALRARKKELHVWTVNDPGKARKMRELGVDSITTDRPGWLRKQLEDDDG